MGVTLPSGKRRKRGPPWPLRVVWMPKMCLWEFTFAGVHPIHPLQVWLKLRDGALREYGHSEGGRAPRSGTECRCCGCWLAATVQRFLDYKEISRERSAFASFARDSLGSAAVLQGSVHWQMFLEGSCLARFISFHQKSSDTFNKHWTITKQPSKPPTHHHHKHHSHKHSQNQLNHCESETVGHARQVLSKVPGPWNRESTSMRWSRRQSSFFASRCNDTLIRSY